MSGSCVSVSFKMFFFFHIFFNSSPLSILNFVSFHLSIGSFS